MKKYRLALLVVIVLLFAFVGCRRQDDPPGTSDNTAGASFAPPRSSEVTPGTDPVPTTSDENGSQPGTAPEETTSPLPPGTSSPPPDTSTQAPPPVTGEPEITTSVPPVTTAPETTTPPPPATTTPEVATTETPVPATIPVLMIETENGHNITSKTEYIRAEASSDDTSEKHTFSHLPVQIRCRGNYTYGLEKKAYRLKFDEKINLFGLDEGKAKSWILLANHCDRSLLRNDTAFAMARALSGIDEVTSSGFVRLYINGEYRGIYQVCEQHTVSKHRIHITEQPDVLDSDYYLEMDSYASGTEGIDYFRVTHRNFVIKNDNPHPDAVGFLKSYFQEVDDAIRAGDEARVANLIDLDSFVDVYILQEFVRNVDVGWSSFYMVKEGGGKLRLTWPWDFDISFGNDVRLGDATFQGLYAGNDDYNGWANANPWFYRLMRRQWFVDRVIARWNEVGESMVQAGLQRIRTNYELYGTVLASNDEVWKTLGTELYPIPPSIAPLEIYGETVVQLKYWIENRYRWLDSYWNDPDHCYDTVVR